MANQFPEVLPEVSSMPTTGWYCQTSGSARRRVTKNSSPTEDQGIYNVKGVPGHTHNASAVVSVDADYSKYRDAAINVPANVWAVGPLNLPIGLLTDSEEPDNANERYDRAIEKCVGYMSLFPENCTGHIREPTRSIGEIRTLVAPKARLETLTYIDEMGGWRVPVGANDEQKEQDMLVSDFPDVRVSMMPRSKHETATLNLGTSPSSLFIDFESGLNLRYRIDPLDAAAGTIGWKAREHRLWLVAIAAQEAADAAHTEAVQAANAQIQVNEAAALAFYGPGGVENPNPYDAALHAAWKAAYTELKRLRAVRDTAAAVLASATAAAAAAGQEAIWDNTIVFSWDHDKRIYKSTREVTVILNSVKAVYKAAADNVAPGAVPATGPIYDGTDAQHHKPRLTVTFPVMQTTGAFDGSCWLASIKNEEALSYATRQNGLTLAAEIRVDILGAGTPGPFKWVGMPALRIPVGGKYALPGPDILQEQFGDGGATDVQYNFYDKFASLTPLGLLRYQYRQQSAHAAHTAAETANNAQEAGAAEAAALAVAATRTAPDVLSFATRALHRNGALFYNRPGGFQKDLYAKQVLRDYGASVQPYVGLAHPLGAQILTSGIREALYVFKAPQVLEADLEQLNAAAKAELDAAEAALSDAHALVNRLRVGSDPEELAVAKAELEEARIAEAAARKTHADTDVLEDAAIAQSQLTHIDPFLPEPGKEGPGRVACFQGGTKFQGTCTFDFPVATFPAGNAPRYWQAGPHPVSQVGTHNYLSVACTPFMFQARATDGLIPIGNLNDAGEGGGNANALHLTTIPTCILDVTQVSGAGTVTCNYDFTKTMSAARGRDYTGNVDGDKFFIAGFTFALSRGEDHKSNVLADYNQYPNLAHAVTAQQLRDIYAQKQFIGNQFRVPYNTVGAASANGVLTAVYLYDYIFATQTISGLLFKTATAYQGRTYMFYVPVTADNLAARVRYTHNGNGQYAAGRARIELPAPKCVTATDGEIVAFPRATFVNIIQAHIDWNMIILDKPFVQENQIFGAGPFAEEVALTQSLGAVFQSRKRISQHVCGPIINPNMRIGAVAPLNYDSRHLPPELRDFRLQFYDIDWSRLQATKTTLNELTLYDFKDGVQKVGSEENVLYLPQFREFKQPVTDGTFEIEIFSELGCPSYFCLFCRSATTDILQQPIIKTLSIFNNTTKKKSNVVQDMSVSQLYHLTQRNVHPAAQYDKNAFRRRQTVLLSTEDIGLLGLKADEYQKAKRVRYVFSGTTNDPGQLYIVLVYNNRGLHIDGRRLQVVTLHE